MLGLLGLASVKDVEDTLICSFEYFLFTFSLGGESIYMTEVQRLLQLQKRSSLSAE